MARILIVEDSFVVAQMIENVAIEQGHSVVGAAPSATAALSIARRLQPDLVILDLQLADGRVGEALARTLISEISASILVCSAFADWVLRHVEERVRPCATVRKPIDLDELRAAIESCLGGGDADAADSARGPMRGPSGAKPSAAAPTP